MNYDASAVKKSNYIMRPYSLFHVEGGRKPSSSETEIKGVVYSYAHTGKDCYMGYSDICQRTGYSKATVWRQMQHIKKDEDFTVERRGGRVSKYTYVGADVDENGKATKHIRTEGYFITTKFKIYGSERCLTPSEVDVLSLIYTHTRKGGKFRGSYRQIAGILNCAEETIYRAVYALFSAELIARPKRGRHKKETSEFCACMHTLRKYQKEANRAQKRTQSSTSTGPMNGVVDSWLGALNAREERERNYAIWQRERNKSQDLRVADLNARADRERHYALLRQHAQNRADKYQDRARRDSQFRATSSELAKIEIDLAKAEVYAPNTLPDLQTKKQRLKAERRAILLRLGISEQDLIPRYQCEKCSDTGFMKNGRACDCYPKGGET